MSLSVARSAAVVFGLFLCCDAADAGFLSVRAPGAGSGGAGGSGDTSTITNTNVIGTPGELAEEGGHYPFYPFWN